MVLDSRDRWTPGVKTAGLPGGVRDQLLSLVEFAPVAAGGKGESEVDRMDLPSRTRIVLGSRLIGFSLSTSDLLGPSARRRGVC